MRCAEYSDVVFNRGSVVPLFMIAANATQLGSARGNERARRLATEVRSGVNRVASAMLVTGPLASQLRSNRCGAAN
jgi:hypothetical protein